jgi:hypothetical protein
MCRNGSVTGVLVEITAVPLNFLFGNSMEFMLLKNSKFFGTYRNNKFQEMFFVLSVMFK